MLLLRLVAAAPLTLWVLVQVLSAQPDRGQPSFKVLLQQIQRAQIRIDTAMSRLKVTGTAVFVARNRIKYSPALTARFTYAVHDGCVLVRLNGPDVDRGIPRVNQGEPPHRDIARLYLPGGMLETRDEKTGGIEYAESGARDPRYMHSVIAPHEYVWSFAGSARGEALARRKLRIESVEGEASTRIVTLTAEGQTGKDFLRLRCCESWGWMASRSELWGRIGTVWVETYRTEVTGIHKTRLGRFPAEVTYKFWDVKIESGRPTRRPITDAKVFFEAPQYTGVHVPSSFSVERGADPLFSDRSFVANTAGLWDRSKHIDELLESVRRSHPNAIRRSVGHRSYAILFWIVSASGWGCLLAAIALWYRRAKPAALVSWTVACVCGVIALTMRIERSQGEVNDLDSEVVVAAANKYRSRFLCGVDALYVLARSRSQTVPYAQVLRLIRPGHTGTSLDVLSRVAECLDVPVRLGMIKAYSEPPVPALCHTGAGHFIVVIGLVDDSVLVFDPGVGIVKQRWSHLRSIVSAPALVPRT